MKSISKYDGKEAMKSYKKAFKRNRIIDKIIKYFKEAKNE